MPRNGSGSYTLPAPAPWQTGTDIVAPAMNTVQTDIAAALTASVAADGQTPITGNWTFGAYTITAQTVISTAAMTAGNGLTVTKGGLTVTAGGLAVTADGAGIVGNSAITGTLGTSGAIVIDAGGLTVKADGAAVTGNSTVTGTLTVTSTVGAAAGTKAGLALIYDQFPTTTGATGTETTAAGLIRKWGTGSTTLGTGTVAFAAAFPTACDNVQLTVNGGSGTATLNPVFAGAVTAAGFAVWGDATESLTYYWQAIGR